MTGSGCGCCSIIDSDSPWMILCAAKRCFRWFRFTVNQNRNDFDYFLKIEVQLKTEVKRSAKRTPEFVTLFV